MTAGTPQHVLEDAVAMRQAGRELLSLALIDARNHLLRRLAQQPSPLALRLATHAGWYQEHWIACHVQRGRGEACDAAGLRLASIEANILHWLEPQAEPPSPESVRGYLAHTLETTLELLERTPEDDAALHFFRQSLLHEDRLCEALDERQRSGQPAACVQREPLWLPAQRWLLGSPPGGLVPANERWAHEVAVPEFEIDAQPVNWAQFVEFADDGGYDRAELWGDVGWAWVQACGRRAPAFVEQLRGGVLVQRGALPNGTLQRAALGQPVMHVSRHEAQAWCRWAGRRLATEPEWEIAACTAASRGFAWGAVFEWVAGSARAWPGAPAPAPGALDRVPEHPSGVLRGASFATRARWHHPQARRFMLPQSDTMFGGFRSCSL